MPTRGTRSDPPSLNHIIPGLYLGNFTGAIDPKTLKDNKIKAIVTLMTDPLPEWSQPPFRDIIYRENHFFKKCDDTLTQDILRYLEDACDFIDRQLKTPGSVLVHCRMGVSRSATVVIAYIMRKYGWTYHHALKHVKGKRNINPNYSFRQQLLVWGEVDYRPWVDEQKTVPKVAYKLILNLINKDSCFSTQAVNEFREIIKEIENFKDETQRRQLMEMVHSWESWRF